MDGDEDGESSGGPHAVPHIFSCASFFSPSPSPSISSSSRRLSSNFSESARPVPTARRLSWLNPQGKLVGTEEASSSNDVFGGSLSREEGLAWDVFSPIYTTLIVGGFAVATGDLKKSQRILELERAVAVRDQELLSLHRMADNLCEQMNTMDWPEPEPDVSFTKNVSFNEDAKLDECKIFSCGCRHCDHHQKDSVEKAASEDEMFKLKPFMIGAEQEERRMSDLSDFASSVTSAADSQLSTLAIEQDIYNMRRECEEKDVTIKEKDATIKELSAVVKATDAAGSKRIAELEEIIRRKNMINTRLKKDMAVLEQKVVQLTRLRRPSSASTLNIKELPMMADNLLYDMSSTSPSSSDSDSPAENRKRASLTQENQETPTPQDVASRRSSSSGSGSPVENRTQVSVEHQETPTTQDVAARRNHRAASTKPPMSLPKLTYRSPRTRPVSPLTENSMNQRPDSPSEVDPKRNRMRTQSGSKDSAKSKRWF